MTANMENEIWKDVVGYEGLYEVSDQGRIRRVFRNSRGEVYERNICPTAKFIVSGAEYARVTLKANGNERVLALHNLVAEAFLPNKGNKPCITHKNGNGLDNRLRNLAWCSEEEFTLFNLRKNSYCNRRVRVLTIEGLLIKKFKNIIDAADFLGINISNPRVVCSAIDRCCRGRQATAYGYKWRYA